MFDQVAATLEAAASNASLRAQLHQQGTIWFLHLLGTDTAGHAHRPASPAYRRAVTVVDAGMRRMAHLLDKFYGDDGRTAYLFTSDHGMGAKGAAFTSLSCLRPSLFHSAGRVGVQVPTETATPPTPGRRWCCGAPACAPTAGPGKTRRRRAKLGPRESCFGRRRRCAHPPQPWP